MRYYSLDVKAVCEELNIKPGLFFVEIGGEKRSYYYDENTGKIRDVFEQSDNNSAEKNMMQ